MEGFGARLPGRMTKPGLAVFVSGVASMGLEILAGRFVAPQFGNSIYTWGSIIGVFLAALSLGYYQGGKRAARRATNERLVWLLLATAGYVAVLIFAGDFLLTAASSFPLPGRYASLPAVTLLFGPPTYLLGFISPYAAELSEKRGTGEASGHVYAVGTIGSIVGAFGTTFLLIPSLSVDRINLVFGVVLVATALVILAPSWPRRPAFASGIVALLLVGAVAAPTLGVSVHGHVVHQTQTPYQELQVVDLGDTRTLYLDGQRHSAMDKSDPARHVFDYTRYFHLPYLMTEDPAEIDRVLFVGGGGFSGPKRFVEEYDAEVHVAEIDPDVIDAAREYFAVDEYEESGQLEIHQAEGREFLRESDEEYDVVVLDAYKRDKVPFQLTTTEFMDLANERLSEDGVMVANVISAPSGPASQFYRSEYRTMDRTFPQVYSFTTSDLAAVQNVELVASKDPDRLSEADLHERNRDREIGIDLADEIDHYQSPPSTDDVPVLRDDRAPVDSLLEPMAGQRYVIEETGEGSVNGSANPSLAATGPGFDSTIPDSGPTNPDIDSTNPNTDSTKLDPDSTDLEPTIESSIGPNVVAARRAAG